MIIKYEELMDKYTIHSRKLQKQLEDNELKNKKQLKSNLLLIEEKKNLERDLRIKTQEVNEFSTKFDTNNKLIKYLKSKIKTLLSEDKQLMKGVLKEMSCYLTLDIIRNPIICTDGQVFEKEAILKWLSTNNSNPLTNKKLTKDKLIKCYPLINVWKIIMKYKDRRYKAMVI